MHSHNKKLIAQLLLFSLLLESCYNFNIPATPQAKLKPTKKATTQQGEFKKKPPQRPPSQQFIITKPIQPPTSTSEHRVAQPASPTQSLAPIEKSIQEQHQLQTTSKQATRPPSAPTKKTTTLKQQNELIYSRQEAQARRKQLAAPLTKPINDLAPSSQAMTKAVPTIFMTQEGHQISFIHQDGQWWARVNEHLPLGFSRRLDLPVYVAPGLAIEELDKLDAAWFNLMQLGLNFIFMSIGLSKLLMNRVVCM